jgi:hypothetical protein
MVMDDVIIASLHVLAVVIWIGGVMMVTTVVLPAVRRGDLGTDRLIVFHAIRTPLGMAGTDSRHRRRADRILHVGMREEEREMLPLCSAASIGVVPWNPQPRDA